MFFLSKSIKWRGGSDNGVKPTGRLASYRTELNLHFLSLRPNQLSVIPTALSYLAIWCHLLEHRRARDLRWRINRPASRSVLPLYPHSCPRSCRRFGPVHSPLLDQAPYSRSWKGRAPHRAVRQVAALVRLCIILIEIPSQSKEVSLDYGNIPTWAFNAPSCPFFGPRLSLSWTKAHGRWVSAHAPHRGRTRSHFDFRCRHCSHDTSALYVTVAAMIQSVRTIRFDDY